MRFSVDEGTLTHWEKGQKGRRVPRGEQLKLVESSLDRMLILSFDGRLHCMSPSTSYESDPFSGWSSG